MNLTSFVLNLKSCVMNLKVFGRRGERKKLFEKGESRMHLWPLGRPKVQSISVNKCLVFHYHGGRLGLVVLMMVANGERERTCPSYEGCCTFVYFRSTTKAQSHADWCLVFELIHKM